MTTGIVSPSSIKYKNMRNIKKTLLKLGVMLVTFVIALFVANLVMNRGNNDMTQDMSPATLPIIYMNVNDEYINPLHGYKVEMEGNYLRGSITPLMANRSVSFKAELYDAVIAKVGYELRPLDMSRLIEDTELENFIYENNEIYATANLKDLIEDDVEYMLIIKLTTSSGEVIRYYTRVINRAELSIAEKVEFVRDFSGKTMNKLAAEDLKQYMESNSEGDNSSYGYVNIHSSFNQLTWGDLAPSLKAKKDLEILEIDEKSACIKLSFQVDISSETHNVVEYFRVLKGNERMYLMEYERTMNQVFDEEKNVVVNGKILHGIIHDMPTRIENDNGSIYCFVQENALYTYYESSNVMARLFSFYDKDNNDERTRFDAHNIKPLEIDSVGNVRFLVYGYMNRGRHEGEVGVQLYYYDAALNVIEEELFIPYSKSYQILENDIAKLAYISARGNLYILLDGAVYSIDINSRRVNVMQDSISEKSFFSANNQSIIAWQIGDTVKEYNEIQIYRLEDMNPTSIYANTNEIVVPLGFMDEDIIYGKAFKSDITTDQTGRTLIPMYSVVIQNQRGEVLKDYKQNGIYVLSIEMQDNMIILSRVTKDEETGALLEAPEDQIMNNEVSKNMKNVLSSVVTEDTETTYQTMLYKGQIDGSLKVTNPKEVVYEGSREINPDSNDSLTRFYVYAKGDLMDIYTIESDSVNDAEEQYGVVVDKRMAYIWEAGNRKSSVKLSNMDINTEQIVTAKSSDDEENDPNEEEIDSQAASTKSSYAECLDLMLRTNGVYKDTYAQLREKSVINVLRDNINGQALELSGCDLSAVLYYVSEGHPVMAMTGGGSAVLIVGYDSKNVLVYDPLTETTTKMGLNDSSQWFEQNGNSFISYVD